MHCSRTRGIAQAGPAGAAESLPSAHLPLRKVGRIKTNLPQNALQPSAHNTPKEENGVDFHPFFRIFRSETSFPRHYSAFPLLGGSLAHRPYKPLCTTHIRRARRKRPDHLHRLHLAPTQCRSRPRKKGRSYVYGGRLPVGRDRFLRPLSRDGRFSHPLKQGVYRERPNT